MAKTYKLKIMVSNHANVYSQWGETNARIRIYRSITGLEDDRVLYDTISMAAHTGESVWTYEYDDVDGNDGYAAWFTFFHAGTEAESGYSTQPLIYGTASTNYVTVDDLRSEGLPSSVDDTRASLLIQRAEVAVEKFTGNYFREIEGTFSFDGNNTHLLHLPLAIIEITSLVINEMSVALDSDYYTVYSGRQAPNDDRKNPKIELKRVSSAGTIYVFGNANKFLKGLNQVVTGKFGFLEPDGTVPLPVQEAVMGLALLGADSTIYEKMLGLEGVSGDKILERTDDHEVRWADLSRRHGRSVWPQWIYDKLAAYHAPRTMSTQNVRWSVIG